MRKAPGTFDRTVPLERTLELIPHLRRRFGITRIGETTHLDRTNLPTICAVVPRSKDFIGVYNGKGTTRSAAWASAVMEAVERQVAADPAVRTYHRNLRDVATWLDLESCGLLANARDRTVACTDGIDLITGETGPVPMALVQCPWDGEPLFRSYGTNGLAAGNTFAEAVYHALAELVERHVWSLAHVACSVAPRYYGRADEIDGTRVRQLTLPAGNELLDAAIEACARAGLHLRILILQEGSLPLVALATLMEASSQPPMLHRGLGCSLSPAHAISRAITEAVQSRVTDVMGAREDILRRGDVATAHDHGRRLKELPENCWETNVPAVAVNFGELIDRSTPDLEDDTKVMLQMLQNDGVGRIVAVDLSPPKAGVGVVRIVAPSLETTCIDGAMKARARALLRPARMLFASLDARNKETCP